MKNTPLEQMRDDTIDTSHPTPDKKQKRICGECGEEVFWELSPLCAICIPTKDLEKTMTDSKNKIEGLYKKTVMTPENIKLVKEYNKANTPDSGLEDLKEKFWSAIEDLKIGYGGADETLRDYEEEIKDIFSSLIKEQEARD